MIFVHRVSFAFAMCVGVASAGGIAQAADYPNRPIQLIVPFAPGGSTGDRLARTLSPFMQAELGQPIVVENKPGASTFIGMQALLQQEPDGHAIAMTSLSTLVLNPILFTKMPYDPDKDLTPVAYLGGTAYALVARPGLKTDDVAGLVELAKAEPGKINYASGNIGNSTHVLAEKFSKEADIRMTHVPFNGSGAAIGSLLGGVVDIFFASADSVVPLIKEGKLKALAVTSAERMSLLPDVPTMVESGYPELVNIAWYALSAPKRTPPEAVEKLSSAINKALADEGFRQQHAQLGLDVAQPGTPQDLAAIIKKERSSWEEVVRPLNIRLD